jgi:hypothetical protein
VKRDVDRAVGWASVAAVALVPALLIGGISVGGGFSGGHTGGPVIPAAGEAPAPAPSASTPAPPPPGKIGTLRGGGTGGAPGKGGTPPSAGRPARDTGGHRVFNRLTNDLVSQLDGTTTFTSEQAKIQMTPFHFEGTTTIRKVRSGKTTTTVSKTVVSGHTETTTTGHTTHTTELSDSDLAAFRSSCDPMALSAYAEGLPLVSSKPGIQLFGKSLPPGKLGFRTYSLDLTVQGLFNYLPVSLTAPFAQYIKPPFSSEGLSGALVADKYNRPWAFASNKVLLPFGVAYLGMIFYGYQA